MVSAPGYHFFQLAASLTWFSTESLLALITIALEIRILEGKNSENPVIRRAKTIKLIKASLIIRTDLLVYWLIS